MQWLAPEMASWLLALPALGACWALRLAVRRWLRRRAAVGPRLAAVSHLSSRRRDLVALGTTLTAGGALAVALMRPERLVETRVPEYAQQDLVLVVDRSVSMRADDIRPSRLARAVAEIKGFLARKPEGIDRVALVAFAGSAVVLSPFTRDGSSLVFFLDWLLEDPEPHFGTDLGTALLTARGLVARDRAPTRKLLVVVSDGDDQGEHLPGALAELGRQGTRVYTIGIGTERAAFIPVAAASGGVRYFEDEEGHRLVTRFSERTLRQIATSTGGQYLRSVTGTDLAAAMQEIARRERRLAGWKQIVTTQELYPAALGLAALAVAVLLVVI